MHSDRLPAHASWTRIFRRAGRRTNLALLGLLVGAFGTGWLAFAAGTPVPATLATAAHGVFGLGVVALVPWKRVIVSRAGVLRVASLALLVLVVVCLVAGFVEVFGGYAAGARLSPIQLHVGAAVLAVPVFVWHLLRHRGQRPRRTDLSRRNLVRTGAIAVGLSAGYGLLSGLVKLAGGRTGTRVATGSRAVDPDAIPATIWLLDQVPALDPDGHRVTVAGVLLSVEELEARAGPPLVARLDCTSGWYADATWTGVALSTLIPISELRAARSIEVTSVTGYSRRFPVAEADALWLATRCQGRRLSVAAGAPVRLVAPHRRGFWWVKWVESVRLSSDSSLLQPPFPLQ